MSDNNYQPILTLILISLLCLVDASIIRQLTTQDTSFFSTVARLRQSLIQQSPGGMAVLRWNPKSDDLNVSISVTGLAPASTHFISLFTGTCTHTRQMVSSLSPLVANAHGIGSSQTMMHHVTDGLPPNKWTMKISNGSAVAIAMSLNARSILCGNVSSVHMTARRMQSTYVGLTSILSPDENADGLAPIFPSGSSQKGQQHRQGGSTNQ